MPPTTSSFLDTKGVRRECFLLHLPSFFVDTKGVGKEGSERMLPTTSSFLLCRYKGSREGGIGENASFLFLPSL